MKKLSYLIIMSLIAALLPVGSLFADGTLVEKPCMDFIVDGEQTSVNSSVLYNNNTVMLPLKETLTALDAANGKNVSIADSGKIVVIKLGAFTGSISPDSKNAVVNGNSVVLTAAPMRQNNMLYIPTDFIALAFTKHVVVDPRFGKVYLRNENEFNQLRQILEATLNKNNFLSRYNLDISRAAKTSYTSGITVNAAETASIQLDLGNKTGHVLDEVNTDGSAVRTDSYYVNNCSYYTTSNSADGTRADKTSYTERQFLELLDSYSFENLFGSMEVLEAELTLVDDQSNSQYILKGIMPPLEKYAGISNKYSSSINGAKNDYIELHVDKRNNHITEIKTHLMGNFTSDVSESYTLDEYMTYKYSGFNDSSTIKLPDYIKNAVENERIADIRGISAADKSTIDRLQNSYSHISIDGMYKNPYYLKASEGILFIMFGNQQDIKDFNALDNYAKLTFMRSCIEGHTADYLGCSTVRAYVIYDGLNYASADVKNDAKTKDLKLIYHKKGEKIKIVVQDTKNNTYETYVPDKK